MKNQTRTIVTVTMVALFLFTSPLTHGQDTIGALSTAARTRVNRAVSNPNYPVTPGDVYNLSWTTAYSSGSVGGNGGGSSGNGSHNELALYVDSDYQVSLEFFGSIDAEGLTFQRFRDRVITIVQEAYPGATIALTISATGEIPVRAEGEVHAARTIPVWGLTRLGDLPENMYTDYASLRTVEIESADGSRETYDVFRARRFGDRDQNPLLRVGDTIRVSAYDRMVEIDGEVRRPGRYELLPDEGVDDLLNFAGGYTRRARQDDVSLTRVGGESRGALTVEYLSQEELEDESLEDGDRIEVASRLDNRPVIFVEGAVSQGGSEPSGSTRLSRTIEADQRLSDFAPSIQGLFTPVSDLDNAYVRRGDLEIIPVDLVDLLHGPGTLSNDPVLQPEDVLVVPFKQFQVTVLGAVNNPGTYPYLPNKSWRYYVEQAGGFNPDLNDRQEVEIVDAEDVPVSKDETIGPEYTIHARRNDARFWYLRTAELTTTTIELF
ncbi:MAG: SLBB domain-containing protein, partial [bacterium]